MLALSRADLAYLVRAQNDAPNVHRIAPAGRPDRHDGVLSGGRSAVREFSRVVWWGVEQAWCGVCGVSSLVHTWRSSWRVDSIVVLVL